MFVFLLIKFLVRVSGCSSYQPAEVQKALDYQLGWFILFLSENVTENLVVVKEEYYKIKFSLEGALPM